MVRLYSSYTSLQGTDYTVEIHDTEWAGAAYRVTLQRPGVEIAYTPVNDDRTTPVITSKADFSIMVDSSDTEVHDFLTDLIASPEMRFRLIVYRNQALYWVGNILADQMEKEDDYYPYALKMSATDSIATLKKVDYDLVGIYDYKSVLDILEQLINRLDSITLFTSTPSEPLSLTGTPNPDGSVTLNWEDAVFNDSNPLLKVVYNWWPEQLPYDINVNPLERVRIKSNTFIEFDRKGEQKVRKWFDVFNQLALEFGFTFMWSDGCYWITQANEYNGSTWIQHTYDTTFTKISSSNISIPTKSLFTEELVRTTGAVERYYPPLREVLVNYYYFEGANLADGFDLIYDAGAGGASVPISSNEGIATFRLEGFVTADIAPWRVRNNYPTDNVMISYRVKFEISEGADTWSLTGGSYWVKAPQGTIDSKTLPEVWRNDGNQFWYFQQTVSPYSYPKVKFTIPLAADLKFPIDGTLTIYVDVYQVWHFDPLAGVAGEWVNTQVDGINPEFNVFDVYFQVYYNGQPGSEFDLVECRAQNETDKNTEVLEYDTYHGDGPNPNILGKIEAMSSDAPVTWVDTTGWRVGNAGGFTPICSLLADEVMRGQTIPVARMYGGFFGLYGPHERLNRSGRSYVFRGGRLNTHEDFWDGNWFQIGLNPVPNKPAPVNKGTATPIPGKTPSMPSVTDGPITSPPTLPPPLIPDLAPDQTAGEIPIDTAITEINITAASGSGIYNAGDEIIIITVSGDSQTFTVAQDVAVGDQVIPIEPATTEIPIPSGSPVYPENKPDDGQFAAIYSYLDLASSPVAVPVTADVWQTLSVGTAVGYAVRFSSLGAGIVQYDGTVTQLMWASMIVSFGVSVNNTDVAFAFAKNGVRDGSTLVYARRISNVNSVQLNLLWLVSMAPLDQLSVDMLASFSGTVDIENFVVLVAPVSSGGLIETVAGGGGDVVRYRQVFSGFSGTQLTVTVNGGNLPADDSKIDVLRNGVEVSPSYWTRAGNVITLNVQFPPDNEEMTVKFFYP